jgi:hypothetical protein
MTGQVLGYFRLEEKTGSGSMGDEYRAELHQGGRGRESHAFHEIVPARVRM